MVKGDLRMLAVHRPRDQPVRIRKVEKISGEMPPRK